MRPRQPRWHASEAGDQGVHLAAPGRPHERHRARVPADRLRCLARTQAAQPPALPPGSAAVRLSPAQRLNRKPNPLQPQSRCLPPPCRIFLAGTSTMLTAPPFTEDLVPRHPVSCEPPPHQRYIYIPTGAAQSCSSISFSSTLTLHSRFSSTSKSSACHRPSADLHRSSTQAAIASVELKPKS